MNAYGEYASCYLCGRCCPTERHHVFGGSNRPKSERYSLVVDLCAECHRTGKNAVHRDSAVMDRLHQEFQQKAMQENNWNVADFRAVFHKNYLDMEE